MAVPTQSELHRPLLEIAASGSDPLTSRQFRRKITDILSLTQEYLQERTSTNASRLKTNLSFALSMLTRAGLVDRPLRGSFSITNEGRELLRTHSDLLGFSILAPMVEERRTGIGQQICPIADDNRSEEDPLKKIEDGHRIIRENLISDLLDSLLGLSPDGFERLALTLLERLGYGEGRVVGRSGDDGVDVIINQDALGLEKVYVQAKRWRQSVGSGEIRNFSGSLQVKGASKGVFVTTSGFTKPAIEAAKGISASGNQTLVLVNGVEMARLLIEYSLDIGEVAVE